MSKRDIFKNVLDAFVQHDGEKNLCGVLHWRIPFCVWKQTWVSGFDKKSIAPNVTGLHYVSIRQVFGAKTLKQIMSYDTQAVNFFNPVLW